MPEQQIIHFVKTEKNPNLLYRIAVSCIEQLMKYNKPGVIKAIVDAGTTSLYEMSKQDK